MIVAKAVEKMIYFYEGSIHDINHFLKVWSHARTIGVLENVDETTELNLELAAVAHDIACPLCREKYGSALGSYQEKEGIPLTKEFYKEFGLPEEVIERVCYLVGHHHTVDKVEGMDYQILLEADFLVNAEEANMTEEAILNFRDNVFRTETGKNLLNDIYFKK